MSDLEGDSDICDYMHLNTERRKNENYLDETVPGYEADAFPEHVRTTRGAVHNIAQEFKRSPQYKKHPGKYGKLSPLSQAIIVLWFIGHQTVITWTTDGEKRIIEQHFNQKGFPGVIGAIDGTHIRIDKPQNNPDSYVNRKWFYSGCM